MKIVVGGCRDFFDYSTVSAHLDALLKTHDPNDTVTFLSGHCSGVDQLTEQYARERGYSLLLFPAEWKRYGRAAGPMCNQAMVEKSDQVVAFWDGKSRGTKSLIQYAQKLQKPLVIIKIPTRTPDK